MSQEIFRELEEAIARQIEPREYLRALGLGNDSIRTVGVQLKCHCTPFCPLSREQKFPTVIVDPAKRTYQCTTPTCPLYKGGPILDLFYRQSKTDSVSALLALAKKLKLELPPELLERLSGSMKGEAAMLLESGNTAGARAALAKALENEPRNPELHRLAGQIEEKEGRNAEAVEAYLRVAKIHIGSKNLAGALETLRNDCLRIMPGAPHIIMAIAETLDRMRRSTEARQERLNLADALEKSGRGAEALALLEGLFEVQPDAVVALRIGTLCFHLGELDRSVLMFEDAGQRAREANDIAGEAEALRRICEVAPHRWAERIRLADMIRKTDPIAAAREYNLASRQALEQHDFAVAGSCSAEALRCAPKDLATIETRGEVLLAQERNSEAAELLLQASDMYRDMELDSEADRLLEAALQAAPTSGPVLERAGKAALDAGDFKEARPKLVEAAQSYRSEGRREDSLRIARMIAASDPADYARTEVATRMMCDYGAKEEARKLLARSADEWLSRDPKRAMQAAQRGLEIEPGDPELLRHVFDANLANSCLDVAVDAAEKGPRCMSTPDELSRAEDSLRTLMEHRPDDRRIVELLAGVLRAQDRRKDSSDLVRVLLEKTPLSEKSERARVAGMLEALAPRDEESLMQIALVRAETGDPGKAEDSLVAIAEGHAAKAQWSDALEVYEKAVALAGVSPATIFKAAEAQHFHGDVYRAQDLFDQYLAAVVEKGDPSEITSAHKKVFSRDPSRRDILLRLARWQSGAGLKDESAATLAEAEKAAEAAGDLPTREAVIAALAELNPHDVLLLERRASLVRDSGDSARATDLFAEAAFACAAESKFAEAARCARPVLADPQHHRHAEIAEAVAGWLEKAGDHPGAADAWDRVAALRVEAADSEGAVLARQEAVRLDPENAERGRLLAQAVEATPQGRERACAMWRDLARKRESAGEVRPAIEAWRHVADLAPIDIEAPVALVRLLVLDADPAAVPTAFGFADLFERGGDAATARKVLEAIREFAGVPSDEWLARFVRVIPRADAAFQLLEAGREALARNPARALELAESSLSHGRSRAAEHLAIDALLAMDNTSAALSRCHAAADLATEEADKRHWLGRAAELDPADLHTKLALMGLAFAGKDFETAARCALDIAEAHAAAGRHGDAVAAIEAALIHVPENVALRERLAKSLEASGKLERAVGEWLALARTESAHGNMDRALAHAGDAVRLDPENARARAARAGFALLAGDEALHESELLAAAVILRREGQPAEAADLLGARHRDAPGSEQVLRGLVGALVEAGRGAEAAVAAAARSEDMRAGGDLKSASEWMQIARSSDPANAAWDIAEAELIRAQGDAATAIDLIVDALGRAIERGEDSAIARICAVAVTFSAGTPEEDGRRIVDSLAAGRRDADALEFIRSLCAAQPTPASRASLARWLAEGLPGNRDVLSLCHELAIAAGDASLVEDSAARLVAAHEEAGDRALARAALEAATAAAPASATLARLLAELLDRIPAPQAELEAAWRRVANVAKDAGDRKLALAASRRLVALVPDDLEAARGLAESCAAEGSGDEAADILEGVAEKLESADPAAAMAASKRVLELRPNSLRALALRTRLSRAAGDEKALLEALNAHADALAAAGDHRAELLAREEASQLKPENIDLAIAVRKAAEKAGDDKRLVKVLLRIAHLASAPRMAAVRRDALARLEALQPDDRFVLRDLGRMQLEAGERDKALSTLTIAAEKFEALGEMQPALELTDLIAPEQPSNAALKTMRGVLLEAVGRREEAVAELEALVALRLRENRPAEAIEALRDILRLAPQRGDRRAQLGELLEQTGENSAAAAEYEAAAAEHAAKGDLEAAMKAAVHALELAPTRPGNHLRLAEIHEARGDVRAAVERRLWLARFHEEAREYSVAVEHIAVVRRLQGDSAAVLMVLAQVLRRKGDNPEAARMLLEAAALADKAADLESALRALEAARELRPSDPAIRRSLAEIYEKTGRTKEALSEWIEVIRHLVEAGEIDRAQEVAADLVARNATDATLRRQIGQAYETCHIPELAVVQYAEASKLLLAGGDASTALEVARHARDLRPIDPGVRRAEIDALVALRKTQTAYNELLDLGHYFSEREKADHAAACYKEAVVLLPAEVFPRQRLASLLETAGRPEEAVAEYRALAELHEADGRLDEAVKVFKRILAIRPDDTRARIGYIEAYKQVGPENDLVDDYLKLAEIHAKRGAVHEAQRIYERLLSLSVGRPDLRAKYVEFLQRNGEGERAMQESHALVGEHIAAGQFKEAAAILARLQPTSENDPEFHLLRGRVHEGTNARGMALRDLRRAAAIFKERNDTERWRETLRAILRVDPYDVEAPEDLIRHLESSGNLEGAVEVILQLAESYEARKLFDFAEGEYRRALRARPESDEIWKRLISVRTQYATPAEMAIEFIAHGDSLIARGKLHEAVEEFSEAVQADPLNIDARLRYVKTYLKIGRDKDIADDIISLGDLLSGAGRVDEALEWYGRLVALDPTNTGMREKMSQTQSRRMREATATSTNPAMLRHRPPSQIKKPHIDTDIDLSATQARLLDAGGDGSASGFLNSAISRLDEEEQQAAITQVINNYRDILSVNAQNAAVRVKLADVLEQVGESDAALRELAQASEVFFMKGDLNQCVAVCERILAKNPRDQKIRDRLLKAINKRDAFKAIESAILFTDPHDADRDTDSRF